MGTGSSARKVMSALMMALAHGQASRGTQCHPARSIHKACWERDELTAESSCNHHCGSRGNVPKVARLTDEVMSKD